MFRIERSGNRLVITMSGKLDVDDMQTALDELVVKSRDINQGTMLYDIIDYTLPSFKAILLEFSRLPSMLCFIKKFRRAAVLTDRAWLKAASELEGRLIPGIEIRAFDRDHRSDAEAWLDNGI
jgi:hypothetical protein